MKKSVLLLLLCFPLGHAAKAENVLTTLAKSPAALAACGPQHTPVNWNKFLGLPIDAHPLPGKALVYFFADSQQNWYGGAFGNRIAIGVDGKWIGRTIGTSFFAVNLPPGEHHLCSTLFYPELVQRIVALNTFKAEAGKTYFFTTVVLNDGGSGWYFHLAPSDPDQVVMWKETAAAHATWLQQAPRRRGWRRRQFWDLHGGNPLKTAAVARICGSSKTRFIVSRDATPTALKQPDPNQALVYLLLDPEYIGDFFTPGGPVVKIGLDGAWKGALQRRSYTALQVPPGEHHLCVESLSRFGHLVQLETLQTQAGQTYFLHTLMLGSGSADGRGPTALTVTPIDADAGRQFVATSYRSIAHEKSRKQQSAKAQRTPSPTKASATK